MWAAAFGAVGCLAASLTPTPWRLEACDGTTKYITGYHQVSSGAGRQNLALMGTSGLNFAGYLPLSLENRKKGEAAGRPEVGGSPIILQKRLSGEAAGNSGPRPTASAP